MDDVGVFRTTIEIQNWELRGPRRALPETLVETGSQFTWIPRRVLEELGIRAQRKQAFEVADGRRIERDIGYALVRAAGTEAPDLVVFAEPGDMTLLGAHSLDGLNLKIDPVRKQLVPAGPVITAAAAISAPDSRKARDMLAGLSCTSGSSANALWRRPGPDRTGAAPAR